jgi:hypothetical protein
MKILLPTLAILAVTLSFSTPTIAQEENTAPTKSDLSTLQSGTYFAGGSMFATSYRVVARSGDRVCLKIADGPPRPYEGGQNITISTVIQQGDRAIVTAMNDQMTIYEPGKFVTGARSGEWEINPGFTGNLSDGLSACLNATGNYKKSIRGPFITGMIYPNAPAQLIAKQPKARINVRQEPGENEKIAHYGLAGDRVKMMYSRRDEAGKMWYQVKFETSGAEGWVRGDFVRRLK